MAISVSDILVELIARPSINPRLTDADDPAAGESRVAAWLCDYFADRRWDWLAQPVHPSRPNVAAVVPGRDDAVLLWEAHQDTVAVTGMVEPFAAACRAGRVYGRGACDVKGGLAAMLAAATRVAETVPPDRRPTLVLASTVNEECGFSGIRALAQAWESGSGAITPETRGPLSWERLRTLRPQAAIVAEPTGLNVVAAHRGVVRWQARTHGRAAHSSRPEGGANAVYAMARVVAAVEGLHAELSSSPRQPPAIADDLLRQCGPPTACVTTIQGGVGANTVPDTAVINIDRRVSPGETPEAAYEELIAAVQQRIDLGDCRLTHDEPWMQSRCLDDLPSRRWAEQLAGVVRRCGVDCDAVGVPYGTNAATLGAAGIPAAVFGPGSIDQAHTVDEFIDIAQLETAVDVLSRIASGEFALFD